MKRMFLVSAIVLSTLGVFAQGKALFNNNVPGVVVTHVYAPLITNPWLSQIGNGPGDYPAGMTSWEGWKPIGLTLEGQYGARSTYAQLLGAPGVNVPEEALIPASGVTTFRSGALAGHVVPITSTFEGIPPDTTAATIQMVAWDNSSGLFPTWNEAKAGWLSGVIAAGTTHRINIPVLGGYINPPPYLTGLESFNLYFVPEPSAFALACLASTFLLVFRRFK